MFKLKYQGEIQIKDIPIQWIPKIEIYYPDLPQFPIMYIHTYFNNERLLTCPVSVSYNIEGKKCTATFTVLSNLNLTSSVCKKIKEELENRIGFSKRITKPDIIKCCKKNKCYEQLMGELWNYIELSYGESIPFGKFYEEIYSIVRFVSAWQPKTGRQSEMRMLYNFMSIFGEEVQLPKQWAHLEYYVIPNYKDVRKLQYEDFPTFKKLYKVMKKLFDGEFTKTCVIKGTVFKVMPKAWKQNKHAFIDRVSKELDNGMLLTPEERFLAARLVDAFNRHAWRAAYFISSFMNINNTDYKMWTKDFFKTLYDNGNKLKGYSEKVMACFLQQGFEKEEIIPVDTWIETFHKYPLGIKERSEFYDSFDELGKMERAIWLASQANKTNMKNFFNILWCQRYGTIGNKELRGINPLSCYGCKLKQSCVGLEKNKDLKVFIGNNILFEECKMLLDKNPKDDVKYICILNNGIPKKAYKKDNKDWKLADEFSGYILTSRDKLSDKLIKQQLVTIYEFVFNKDRTI